MDYKSLIKRLFPRSVKDWVKTHPGIANPIDMFLNNEKAPMNTNILTMVTHDERRYLFELAKQLSQGQTVLEIGCYAGGSTLFLGRGAEQSGAQVYSIDPFDAFPELQKEHGDGSEYLDMMSKKPSKEKVAANLKKGGLDNTVTLIKGYSTGVANSWDKGKVHFLWIDGHHEEADKDFYAWRDHLAKDALVAFHDSAYPGRGREKITKDVEDIVEKEKARIVGEVDSITTIQLN